MSPLPPLFFCAHRLCPCSFLSVDSQLNFNRKSFGEPHATSSAPLGALPLVLATMCIFLKVHYLQIATVIQLNQLKSGNELPSRFGAFVDIKELQGRFAVWLINQLHVWDSKGLAKELRGALQERNG